MDICFTKHSWSEEFRLNEAVGRISSFLSNKTSPEVPQRFQHVNQDHCLRVFKTGKKNLWTQKFLLIRDIFSMSAANPSQSD